MPLHRRVPKRGFHNPFRQEYQVVNLDNLAERFEAGIEITPELLRERGLVGRRASDQGAGAGRHREGADRAGAQVQRQGGREDRGGWWERGSSAPERMLQDSLKNIFAVPELRKRVLFTLGLLAAYRVGGHIPTRESTPMRWHCWRSRPGTRCSGSTTCSPARTCRR